MIKVRHPEYVMLSSDYSQQEPKILAAVSNDETMIKAFQENKDIYATIASLAFRVPYEECLEFNPITHDYQPQGKARRTQAKSIVLGITYGRSTVTIGQQLFGSNDDMSDDDKTKEAQRIYDAVLNAFPSLKEFMNYAQSYARKYGYTETILGRRRHIPDMQLPRFEFMPMNGYVNPDIDPLDVTTLENESKIPDRVVHQLETEFNKFKYYGQIVKRTKELQKEKIKVVNNTRKITDATRQCVNCVDADTEILTMSGWKKYNEVSKGDSILAYDLNRQMIVKDNIKEVHKYSGSFDVVNFISSTFNAVSTPDHRWVCQKGHKKPKFITAENIEGTRKSDYSILRVADNLLKSSCYYSDDELEFIAYLFTNGNYIIGFHKSYSIHFHQSVDKSEDIDIYQNLLGLLDRLNLKYSNYIGTDGLYHEIYIEKCLFSESVVKQFPYKYLTFEFISSLDQHQADILMRSMIKNKKEMKKDQKGITYTCDSIEKSDTFQYLAFVAGYATDAYKVTSNKHDNYLSYNRMYISTTDQNSVQMTQSYYVVNVISTKKAQIYPYYKSRSTVPFVWCVSTGTSTWVCRRHGKVTITGNSIIQGSAADLTKIAILKLDSNKRWHQIGGRLLVPVHDELICEVPENHWEEGRDILKSSMETAGSFLPFSISCDIEITKRWYGLSFPVKYPKPTSFSVEGLYNMDKEHVKWIQYNLVEAEYVLPVIADKDTPIGDEAKGINGIVTDEMISDIEDYMHRFGINESRFINHMDSLVQGRM